MLYPSLARTIGIAALTFWAPLVAVRLDAQGEPAAARRADRPDEARELDRLARDRVRLWARTAPILHCVPAPLTEQPLAAAEQRRPPVLPLEHSFADAERVRRRSAFGHR